MARCPTAGDTRKGCHMTLERTVPTTSRDVDEIFAAVKNWGRWGAEDERGALNFITPDVRRRAAATVSEGITVSCALPLNTESSAQNVNPVRHLMMRAGDVPNATG